MILKENIKFKNIFFDFDGVVAESVSAKTEAFREMYIQYGEDIANKVVDYHINNGGLSRFEKFRHWEKSLFGRDISNERLEEMAEEFSSLVLQKVINSQEVFGATDFIKKYSKGLNFWIITGTPTTEIEVIVRARNIKDYFLGVHGSPKNKRYWTEYLIRQNHLVRDETLFLGDATTDRNAAEFSRIHFFLRENDENRHIFKNFEGNRFKDFYDLESQINKNLLLK